MSDKTETSGRNENKVKLGAPSLLDITAKLAPLNVDPEDFMMLPPHVQKKVFRHAHKLAKEHAALVNQVELARTYAPMETRCLLPLRNRLEPVSDGITLHQDRMKVVTLNNWYLENLDHHMEWETRFPALSEWKIGDWEEESRAWLVPDNTVWSDSNGKLFISRDYPPDPGSTRIKLADITSPATIFHRLMILMETRCDLEVPTRETFRYQPMITRYLLKHEPTGVLLEFNERNLKLRIQVHFTGRNPNYALSKACALEFLNFLTSDNMAVTILHHRDNTDEQVEAGMTPGLAYTCVHDWQL